VNNQWSIEAAAVLRELWEAGDLSSSLIADEIAVRIGFVVTRNAVIGKAARLGLGPKGLPLTQLSRANHQDRRRVARPAPIKMVVLPGAVAPKPPPPPPTSPGMPATPPHVVARPRPGDVTIFDLDSSMCRWPVDGAGAETTYCGRCRVAHSSYCLKHTRLAFQCRAA
jgi:hypothetical protein